MNACSEVIAAIATPEGEGALGILRLSGPGALGVARAFLRTPRGLEARAATLAAAYAHGRLLDRVVAVFFPGPHSYTGEDTVEVTAHGSPFVLAALLEAALRAGARAAEPGEFTQRAFLNGRMDLAQAEAVAALIRARTRRAHRAALEAAEGGLSRRLKALREGILGLLAELEASLDHPEEDLAIVDPREATGRIEGIRAELDRLAGTWRFGRLATLGARVAVVGPPNAGKSSLYNALLRRERAIVSDLPGTTRDALEEPADLDGLQVVLVDTAGLREGSQDPVERAGMERARQALARCDLALAVLDRSRPLGEAGRALIVEAAAGAADDGRPWVVALNKSDLPAMTRPDDVHRTLAGRAQAAGLKAVVEVSALAGDGLEALVQAVAGALGPSGDGGGAGGAIVTELRHRLSLEEATRALACARDSLGEPELACARLREALDAVGAIVGATATEELLRTIFSRFCIGK